jgi:hypothetical protein
MHDSPLNKSNRSHTRYADCTMLAHNAETSKTCVYGLAPGATQTSYPSYRDLRSDICLSERLTQHVSEVHHSSQQVTKEHGLGLEGHAISRGTSHHDCTSRAHQPTYVHAKTLTGDDVPKFGSKAGTENGAMSNTCTDEMRGHMTFVRQT